MLNSLEIRNFRNLKELKISYLGGVNLFIGKNNTGKSTLLEAIALYAAKGDLNFLYQLLIERGENYKQNDANKDASDVNIKALSSFFSNRNIGFKKNDSLLVGKIENTLFGEQHSNDSFVAIRFVKYFDEIINEVENDLNQPLRGKRVIIENEIDGLLADYRIGLEVRSGSSSYVFPLDRERPYRLFSRAIGTPENYQFIRTKSIDREINGKLWDSITLSEKEGYVVEALRIIEPDVERIAFVEEGQRERTAVVKLKSSRNVLPLKSMGDGINRILTIILALVNSDNGYLLIDEFENGLHYSVQEKLWKIIFTLSEKLNIQVFATTHSEDCIFSFENVLNKKETQLEGKLIRLELINGYVRQVEFSADELKIANAENIETR
jgi:AAA15 family ATPase/GTPase